MSDREFQTASSAATALGLNMTGGGFTDELDRIDTAMQTILDNKGQLVETGGVASAEGGDDFAAAESAEVGETVTINGVQYKKTGPDAYEPI